MWNSIKRFFGFGKKPVEKVVVAPNKPTQAPMPSAYTRANVKRSQYYRRNGKFYAYDDDSEIEDLILLALLLDVFSDDIAAEEMLAESDERASAVAVLDGMDEPSIEEVTTSVDEIEAAVNEVRETYVAPAPTPEPVRETYVAPAPTPEPVRETYVAPEPSYSSSYDSGSSSYDSGSSDCGGGCD